METKKASGLSLKHVVLSIILLIIFVLVMGVQTKAETFNSESTSDNVPEVVPCELSRTC